MATQNRRSSVSSSRSSSSTALMAKKHSISENNCVAVKKPAKNRPPLANITNQRNSSMNVSIPQLAPCEKNVAKMKKRPTYDASIPKNFLPKSMNVKSSAVDSSRSTYFPKVDQPAVQITAAPASSCMNVVPPSQTDVDSVSFDDSMSTSDSLKSPEFECIDNYDASAINFFKKKTFNGLNISDHVEISGDIFKKNVIAEVETIHKVTNIDDNLMDPQLCAMIASDIYKTLFDSESKKRPSIDFMERVQTDINANMRAVLIDWLVEVAEEYMLRPETLFLAVNYVDRYLSGNNLNKQRLQLLGVACMMIASKYEEVCAPQVEQLCYITDHTYSRDEVLQMESNVLNCLKFEMAVVTARCFLRRFVRAAQIDEVPSMHLEYMASYLSELSLLDYSMLCYSPSLIAASATFLAKFIFNPSKRPWSATLKYYTLYKPSDLRDCVKALHHACCNNSSSLPAIKVKYSQHNYKFVAKKYCPLSMPPEYFHDISD